MVSIVTISTFINLILKFSFARNRPLDISLIIETGYSFPSGHAMNSTTFYGFIIYLIIKSKMSKLFKWICSSLLVLLIINICLSRIYLGVHFASDIICGVLLSICLLLIIIYVFKNMRRIKMKVLITGASSGIGKEMALYLNNLGHELILVGRDLDKLEEVKNNCQKAKIIKCDLSDENEVISLHEKVKNENLDVLINNAGFGLFGYFHETELENELKMINVNIKAVHILTKLF